MWIAWLFRLPGTRSRGAVNAKKGLAVLIFVVLANWGREGRYFTQILAVYQLGMNRIECGVCGLICLEEGIYEYLETPTRAVSGDETAGSKGKESKVTIS